MCTAPIMVSFLPFISLPMIIMQLSSTVVVVLKPSYAVELR